MISKTFVAGMVVGGLFVAGVSATTALLGAVQEQGRGNAERTVDTSQPSGKQDQGDDARSGAGQGRGGWRGGDGPRRELSEEEIDRAIATAREVNPLWADELVKLRQSDPKSLRERLGRDARKLMGLSMMKEREPDLYRVRVEDIRVQFKIRELGEAWNAAKQSNDLVGQETLMKEIQENARRQVELDIQARGFEFVALDKSLKEARRKLQDDIRDREQSVEHILEAIRKGEDPKFGRRPGGPGGMGGSNGGASTRSRGNHSEQNSKPSPKPLRQPAQESH